LLSGVTTPAYFTPAGYSWIYAKSPQVVDIPCARRYDVSIELATVPPEGANINGFNLTVTASLAAGAVSGDLGASAPGAALTVAVSLTAGAVSGDLGASVLGFDLTVTASLAAGAASVISQSVSHSWAAAGSTASLSQRLGYQFTVGSTAITCQSLGLYLPSSSLAERVMIHRVDTAAVVASADITSAANAWVDVSITPVVLSAGVQYVISSRSTTGASRTVYRNATGLTFNSAINLISYKSGTGDTLPTTTLTNTYAFARFLFT
jgi:hypothetical protein